MSICLDIKNPLRLNGLSQQERLLDALIPENFKLDDRSVKDLLAFTHQYAEMVAYFDEDNKHNGNWTCFWEIEPLVLLATLASMDTDIIALEYKRTERAYRKAKKRFEEDENCKVDESPAFLDHLIRSIFDIARHIQDIFAKLPDLDALKEFKGQIRDLVIINFKGDKEDLQKALVQLIAYDKFAHGAELNDYETFINSKLWNLTRDDYFCILPSADLELEDLGKLFLQFLKALKKLVGLANSHFDRLMASGKALHEPHIALFITFLRLFKHAQDFLNSLTKKHLDYYYEQVLCLHRRPEQADELHVIFELAKDFHQHHIEKGTLLNAGGNLQYETLEEWTVNSAQVAQIKTIYLKKTEDDFQIHALPAADTEDWEKQPFQDPNAAYWRLFGDYDDGIPQEKTKAEKRGEMGFAIASPFLLLEEGNREIIFHLQFDNALDWAGSRLQSDNLILDDILSIHYSSQDKWEVLDTRRKEGENFFNKFEYVPQDNKLTISLMLLTEDMPVVSMKKNKGNLPLSEKNPVFKFIIKDQRFYQILKSGKLNSIVIDLEVTGIQKNLIIQNDFGIFKPNQKFHPFGTAPEVGANFYIGNREAFSKQLSQLDIVMEWADLPGNFNAHYKGYGFKDDGTWDPKSYPVADNNFFKANADYLDKGEFKAIKKDLNLFDTSFEFRFPYVFFNPRIISVSTPTPVSTPTTVPTPTTVISNSNLVSLVWNWTPVSIEKFTFLGYPKLLNTRVIRFNKDEIGIFVPKTNLSPFEEYERKVDRGFIRINLNTHFFHKEYPKVAFAAAKTDGAMLPNAPYTPAIVDIFLNYDASHSFSLTANSTDEFFYLTPFDGYKEKEKGTSDVTPVGKPLYLFGQAEFNNPNQESEVTQGNLYLGIKDLRPGQNLALLVQVREGSEREFDAEPPTVVWSYLGADNEWLPFAANRILQDDTLGLTRSGIIQLAIPYNIVKENTLLDPTLYWLRAAVVEDSDKKIGAFPDVIAIKAQAIKARYRRQDRESAHLAAALPPKTIKKLAVADFHVKKVEQPYPSFNGKISEQGNEFYRRVSERLRHRDRAVTIYDYEHLLLEQYPDVQRVRCLNHTRWLPGGTLRELAPGYVAIVVIPTLRNRNIFNRAQPRVPIGNRREMEEWLRTKTNLFVREPNPQGEPYFRVINPAYEPLQVKCRVAFQTKLDPEYYKQRLNEDLKRLLAPWMFDDGADITFGRILYQSQIMYFIETREYVEAVADFSVVRRDGNASLEIRSDTILPLHAHGILTTYIKPGKAENETDHDISVIELNQLCLPVSTDNQP